MRWTQNGLNVKWVYMTYIDIQIFLIFLRLLYTIRDVRSAGFPFLLGLIPIPVTFPGNMTHSRGIPHSRKIPFFTKSQKNWTKNDRVWNETDCHIFCLCKKHVFETVYRFLGPATWRSEILNIKNFFFENLPVGGYADWGIGPKM